MDMDHIATEPGVAAETVTFQTQRSTEKAVQKIHRPWYNLL
jgi:hypothetical protein